MSGMFLNRPTATPNIAAHPTNTGRPESQAQHFGAAPRTLSPLEPAHHSPSYTYSNYSRRGSITDPALHSSDHHRPSLHDINLPIPTSNNVSRRGSIATNTSSRSPSPAPFAQTKPYDDPHYNHYAHRHSNAHQAPAASSVYEPFQRRHSIANSELQQQPSADPNRRYTGKQHHHYLKIKISGWQKMRFLIYFGTLFFLIFKKVFIFRLSKKTSEGLFQLRLALRNPILHLILLLQNKKDPKIDTHQMNIINLTPLIVVLVNSSMKVTMVARF
jgi:hypothetical protein